MKSDLWILAAVALTLGWTQVKAERPCQFLGSSPETYFSPVHNVMHQGFYTPVPGRSLATALGTGEGIEDDSAEVSKTIALNDEYSYLSSRYKAFKDARGSNDYRCTQKMERAYAKARKKRSSKLAREYREKNCSTVLGVSIDAIQAQSSGSNYSTEVTSACQKLKGEYNDLDPFYLTRVQISLDEMEPSNTAPATPGPDAESAHTVHGAKTVH
jgi:hypothetical protein